MPITRVRVNEQASELIEFDITDANGQAVPVDSLLTAALTLYDVETFDPSVSPRTGILNTRDEQDVLNGNNVTIDTAGHVEWTAQPEDNVIVTERRQVERHSATFDFTWSGGAFHHELEIEVVNLRSVD